MGKTSALHMARLGLERALQLVPDPSTGLAVPTVDAGLRSREIPEQYETFVGIPGCAGGDGGVA